LVEDHASLGPRFKKFIEKRFGHCDHASTSHEARRYLERETYDIVVTDWNLEREGAGEQVIDYAGRLPVIVITGRVESPPGRAKAIVGKPFALDELFSAIESVAHG
ncbi:MAG: response regulator, partial [Myxococcota bacterium]